MLPELSSFWSKFSVDVQVGIVIFVIVIVLSYLIQNVKKWNRMPPGPWGYPIVGHLPSIGKVPFKTFNKMRQKYGDIILIRLGSWPTVILNNRKVIHEAFVRKGESFADRPGFFSLKIIQDHHSLLFGKFDSRWKMHRKIANDVLRAFVNMKDHSLEELIQKEALALSDDLLSNRSSTPVNPHDKILLAIGSIMYQILYGIDDNCKDNEDFRSLVVHIKNFGEFCKAGNPIDVMPWLRYFLPQKTRKFMNLFTEIVGFRKKKVSEHIETFDENCLRDATDGFIMADKQLKESGIQSEITSEQIFSSIEDLIGAGEDTMTSIIEWSILFMAVFPEVQHRIQNEIDDVIGQRKPSIKHRGKLVYTEATILEMLRFASVSPLALPHATVKDVELYDYFIPKGTVVFANLYAVTRDENMWTDPEKFNPERFLTEHNEISLDAAEYSLSFGAGRRKCPGDYIAKIELFIIFTTLLQRCKFEGLPGLVYDLDGHYALTNDPKPFSVNISKRF